MATRQASRPTPHTPRVSLALLLNPRSAKMSCMVFEPIEELKRQYTDRYVLVDESRPELARFRGVTGIVKTVNMSGRALVEFQDYIANIGWYDIDLDFLTVVPKPEAKVAVPHGEKPAAKAKPATGESVAKPQAAAKPAAVARPEAAAKPGGKPSTADILAAARAKKAAAAGTEIVAPTDQPAPAAAEPKESTTIAETPPAPAPMKPQAKSAVAGTKPTTTAEIIAYCRRIDAKS